jgi:hypothetical protein
LLFLKNHITPYICAGGIIRVDFPVIAIHEPFKSIFLIELPKGINSVSLLL